MRTVLTSQTVIAARDEINKSAVAQVLKLLTNFGFDVLVTGIEITEMPLESIDLVEREVAFAERFHALHDVEQPAARLRRFIPEEKRLLPFREDQRLRADEAALHDMNFARLRDAAEQYIRPDPACTSRGDSERLSFFDDLADEKVLRHDEEINDRQRLEIVVHQEEIRIVARGEAFALSLERAIDNPCSELSLLTLEFEFFVTGRAKEISERTVVGKG